MSPLTKMNQSNLDYVESLLEKALDAEQKNTDEALKLATEALELSKKYTFKKQEARSDVRIGRCHWINGNYNEAIEFLTEGLAITDNINESYTKSDALIGLGNVYVTIGLLDQAITHYNNALSIAESHGYGELESKIYNNIGTLHEDLKNYPLALDYYQKSLAKTVEMDDGYGTVIANINIGNVYLSLNDLEKSEKYILESVTYGNNNQKTLLLAHCYYSLGRLYKEKKDFKESIKYLRLGIDKANESKDLYILFRIYIEHSLVCGLVENYKNAENYLLKAFELSKQIGMDELMPRIHESMAKFYEKNNQSDLAYKHFQAYFQASKVVEENRRIERIKSVEYQSKLTASLEETRIYRQLSNELRRSYQQMHILSNIGQAMTSTHELSDIFEQLYENVNLLMNAESLGVGLYVPEANALRFDLFIEKGQALDPFDLSLDNKKSWSVFSFVNRQTIKINDIEKEYQKYIEGFAATRGHLNYSAMYAPLMVEGEVIGVFSIQAKEKNAYSDNDKDLIQTLASYLAIAIKNIMKTEELAKLNNKLKILSEKDGLTGVANRRLYDEMIPKLWNQAIDANEPLSMMIVDIDNFKDFNDHYGHMTGDEVIKKVASLLLDGRRNEEDFVARYGGDEFIMLLPNCNLDEANLLASKLQNELHSINESFNIKKDVTISIGISTTHPNSHKAIDNFVSLADLQLYASKESGKNKISSTIYK
ncbi:MAG: diguanylate cyclase [Acholeplasmataceae bacterium]|nr:diguanylate cyclase [Acholeplasmataceae bacterium]MDD4194661.1 diguanylate cyclase [Acholeplasmataceae bacterium]